MKNKIITTVALVTCLSLSTNAYTKGRQAGSRGAQSIAVVAQTVAEHQISQSLSLIGKLEASESVVISPEAAGRIEKISIKSNQDVKQGQLLVKLNDDKARAQVSEAKAYLNDQKRILVEYQRLLKRGAITQTEIEGQKSSVDIAQARLDSAQADLNDLHIKAPFNGTVGFVDFSRGKLVSVGAQLLTLDNLDLMELDVQVPERYLSMLSNGMKVTATSQAWQQIFTGEIVGVDSRVNKETLNLRVRVHFGNENKMLKPGMLMAVDIAFPAIEAPIIPVQALEYSGTKRYVYVIDADNKAKRTEITLGARVENEVVVESGLEIGQTIVTQGIVNMRDGASVRVLSSNEQAETKNKPAKSTSGQG